MGPLPYNLDLATAPNWGLDRAIPADTGTTAREPACPTTSRATSRVTAPATTTAVVLVVSSVSTMKRHPCRTTTSRAGIGCVTAVRDHVGRASSTGIAVSVRATISTAR